MRVVYRIVHTASVDVQTIHQSHVHTHKQKRLQSSSDRYLTLHVHEMIVFLVYALALPKYIGCNLTRRYDKCINADCRTAGEPLEIGSKLMSSTIQPGQIKIAFQPSVENGYTALQKYKVSVTNPPDGYAGAIDFSAGNIESKINLSVLN